MPLQLISAQDSGSADEAGWNVVTRIGSEVHRSFFPESRLGGDGVVLGRSQDCDMVVDIPSLSRQHCRLCLVQGELHVTDIGAKNGVYVDGRRLTANERVLLAARSTLRCATVEFNLERVGPQGDFDGTLLGDEDSFGVSNVIPAKKPHGDSVGFGGSVSGTLDTASIHFKLVDKAGTTTAPIPLAKQTNRQGGRNSLIAVLAVMIISTALAAALHFIVLPDKDVASLEIVPLSKNPDQKSSTTLTTAEIVTIKGVVGKSTIEKHYRGIKFGRFNALVIGNNDYLKVAKLQNAVHDARAVADTLATQYGFNVILMLNGSRADIVSALDQLRGKMTVLDNLLIFYAGHGYYDKITDRGYWLPTDADATTRTNWISNVDITDSLKAIQAKHIIIVADSCYSGTLTRAAEIALPSANLVERINALRSRTVLASGGIEPVIDGGGKKKHSIFTSAFLDALKANKGVLDGVTLYNEVRNPVRVNADQMPSYSDIRNADHEVGGDFLFLSR